MNFKRMAISGFVTGLLVWGLSELFQWILADLIGAGDLARIAPGLAGLVLGITMSALVQMIKKKRQEMLSGGQ
ncbi:MAG: hypothetical protein JRJ19_03585 [Deltaproteobacteria bacterium]|nr:hypothetical protein [Deltaproteobacteria bacterium]MBW1871118.1 hypothetical protein [Deltaproteobacteria bacterium]